MGLVDFRVGGFAFVVQYLFSFQSGATDVIIADMQKEYDVTGNPLLRSSTGG